MSRWSIIVPVWGERYLNIFINAGLPALRQAVRVLRASVPEADVEYVFNTDTMDVSGLRNTDGVPIRGYPVPSDDRAFESLSQSHRAAIARANINDRLVLLTADLVISSSSLLACHKQFEAGKLLVCCMGMRVSDETVVGHGMDPAIYASGRTLLGWGWDHRHPMTRECTWPDGHSYDLWRMYFEKDDEVACRLCLPHPIALVRDSRPVHFAPTIDVNVAMNYTREETHLVTDPAEVAMIELSPPEKDFIHTESMRYRYDNNAPSLPSFGLMVNDRHRHFFGHKIIVKGKGGNCGDQEVVSKLLGPIYAPG